MPHYRAPVRTPSWFEKLSAVTHRGTKRFCPVCKSNLRHFTPYGHVKRQDAKCPVCQSVERHRFTWAFFERCTDLFDGKPKRMLHVAPEPAFEKRLRAISYIDYTSSDPQDKHADVAMDITRIQYPDDSFDVIHCSHVLEHVSDDKQAMRELSRVLRPAGWATILVPIIAERSWEDPSITAPEERARAFGQWDHVRAYGPDFQERLASQGFDVRRFVAADLLESAEERERVQFKDEDLYFCRKRGGGLAG